MEMRVRVADLHTRLDPRVLGTARARCSSVRAFFVLLVLATCKEEEAPPYVGFVDAPVSSVAAQTSGRVVALGSGEGDRVHRGQSIALIDSSSQEAAVAMAEAKLDRIKHDKHGWSELRVAEVELELAQADLEKTRVLAPFDGIVLAKHKEIGEWASVGGTIMTIEDTSRPSVRLDVEEMKYRDVEVGRQASIVILALGARAYRGHVLRVGALHEGKLDVRLAFDEPPDDLRPGMTAQVRISDKKSSAPIAEVREAQLE